MHLVDFEGHDTADQVSFVDIHHKNKFSIFQEMLANAA
jgi:hypothetical protein